MRRYIYTYAWANVRRLALGRWPCRACFHGSELEWPLWINMCLKRVAATRKATLAGSSCILAYVERGALGPCRGQSGTVLVSQVITCRWDCGRDSQLHPPDTWSTVRALHVVGCLILCGKLLLYRRGRSTPSHVCCNCVNTVRLPSFVL